MVETQKIRMLCLFDYCCATGFASVSSNIMRELKKTDKYDVDILGINYTGDPYDSTKFPFNVYPAVTIETMHHGQNMDVYGRDKFLSMLVNGNYDLVFIIQDTFVVQTFSAKMFELIEQMPKKPKTIFYYPLDAAPDTSWIQDTVAKMDYPVPYTGYAAEETLKVLPDITKLRKPMYHGTNTDEFFYIPDRKEVQKFRHDFFDNGVVDNKFLILNVNRNQPRKDILRSLQVIKCLRELGDLDSILYLHMQYNDAGGNILTQAQQLGLEIGKDYILPTPQIFNSQHGIPIGKLNMLYNAADCLITTTHGEGWGLSLTEAMATKTPVVAPNNTSMTEMLADNRGKLVESGESWESWIVKEANDNSRLRPIVNVEKMARAILEVKAKKDLPDIDNAHAWVHKYSWSNICKEWVALFQEAASAAKQEEQKRKLKTSYKKGVSKKQRRKAKK